MEEDMLDDVVISRAIVETYFQDLLNYLENDVAIAGAGPAGLTAAYFLAKKGRKVAIFERQLRVGGGMPGGGMMFNKIVIQEETKKILDEFGIRYQKYQNGYYVADSLETTSLLTSKAIQAGAKIFNLIAVEDLSLQEGKVNGLVLNWSAVKTADLHVDPITIRAKAVVDATGHDAVLCRLLVDKGKVTLRTPTGKVAGEGPMWAEKGEEMIIANTGEVFPGLFIAGMTVNAVCGGPRMGPIFGGMLLSGERLSLLIP